MQRQSWDDLRFVLAVAETGSVAGAARTLDVNHATVLRRIAAFEARVGQPVFERTAHGYRLPPDQFRLIEAAREVAAAVDGVERLAKGTATAGQAVRVTSTDSLCVSVLPGIVAELTGHDMTLELRCSNAHLDLGRLHADIAIRPAASLPSDLVGEIAAEMNFAVYATPEAPPDWLALQGPLARAAPAEWLTARVGEADIVAGADSFVVLREMAAAGLGRVILPMILGDGDSRLVRQEVDLPDFRVPVWVACHAEMADAPRLRRIRKALVERIGALSDGFG